MRTIEINVYEFDELSESAKENAHNNWLQHFDYPWGSENEASLKGFEEAFPIRITNWSYGGRGEGVSFNMNDVLAELSGQRLATWIYNNCFFQIIKGKYYSLWSKKDKNPHYRENGHAPYGKLKSRHSKVIFVRGNCPFTGYCMDESLLDEVWKFLDKPDDRNFYDLMEDCLNAWISDCANDLEYHGSMECFKEMCEANEYEFNESGEII